MLRIGCSVLDLSMVGNGAPDMLVGFRGVDQLLEVKRDAKAQEQDNQVVFRKTWQGRAVVVIRSLDEALLAIGLKPPASHRPLPGKSSR